MKRTKIGWLLLVGLFTLLSFRIGTVEARMEMKRDHEIKAAQRNYKLSSVLPFPQLRVHRVGLLQLSVTNWGVFGSQMRGLSESRGGCFNPHPDEEVQAPSAEYPVGSGLEYLFQGGLWIGAMVDDYPYTTVACDGWQWIYEMWPDSKPEGAIQERSIRFTSPCYSPDAISEQDVIAVYTDTSADIPLSPQHQDPWDNRKHFPLGIQITQKSYSWSYEYAEDFVLIDLILKNIGVKKIKDMYLGLYMDADAQHVDENPYGAYGAQDDICGFRRAVGDPGAEWDCSDTVNLAWIADNDGHGIRGEKIFTSKSPISVTGTRVVRVPKPGLKYSFNWWISNQGGAPRDWGPWRRENLSEWRDFNICYPEVQNTFPDNVLGTPGGDCSKYFIMSNEEFDYDQIFSCTAPGEDPDWLEASPECDDLADGYDTRYLLSFGPFDQMAPGESLIITVAYVAGADFHVDPANWQHSPTPEDVYANLNFSDFETNAKWAAFVYDNPDPPDFPCGDGIPDFKGPPPPPSPTLSFETELCKVEIRWNGKTTERNRDSFSGRADFEGYRVYMSRTGAVGDYALLGSYDKVDFKIYKLNRYKEDRPWEWRAASVSLDSLRSWLDGRGLEPLGDNPNQFTRDHPFVIEEVMQSFYIRLSDSVDADLGYAVVYDSIRLESFDSLYFEVQDWNVGFDDIVVYPAYRDSVDLGLVADTADRYWDYEYEIVVVPVESLYFAVTAFDVGDPQTGLPPLESSKLANATLVYPCYSLGSISGTVSDSLGGLLGVTVDLFDGGGVLAQFTYSDTSGFFEFDSLDAGDYTVSIVTPLGYVADFESRLITLTMNADSVVDFTLHRLPVVASQRGMGYWKHQVNVHLSGKGHAHESLVDMSNYVGLISEHFNNNLVNPVTVFDVPQPATQTDSLEALQDLLTVRGEAGMNARAKQQLIALMLNVVSLKLHQTTPISEDSATVSQAITYCNHLITDADHTNDETAKDIAGQINNGILVAPEVIPLVTPNIAYRGTEEQREQTPNLPREFSLEQNYPNPFNPRTVIKYTLPQSAVVNLAIYNILGQRVRTVVDEYQTAGYKTVHWDGTDEASHQIASGIYFYRIQAGEFTDLKKMILMK